MAHSAVPSPAPLRNLIGGEWRAPSGDEYLDRTNPADTRELVARLPASTVADTQAAVAAAAAAYPAWRATPAPKRAEVLYRAGQLLIERKERYAEAMTREMGKVLCEARGDVQEAIDMLFFMAGEGRRLYGQTTPSELVDKMCFTQRMPLGVAGLVTPWNFPMAIPSWKLAPCLLCGNTAVLKPAEDAPLSAQLLVETLIEAGLPPGVVNLVHGRGEECGAALVRNAGVRIVSFTGSTAVGREVGQQAARDFKHCNLELGGKNAILILPDADLELAAQGCAWGGYGTSGQRCTAASRLIVHEAVHDKFLKLFLDRVSELRVGNGLEAGVQVGPLINASQCARVMEFIAVGKREARLALGGERLGGDLTNGHFIAPTVFTDVQPAMRIAQEEIFGPVVAVLRCGNLEDGIAIANGVAYGLSSSIYTSDVRAAFQAMRDLDSGIVYVNAPSIGAEVHLPFGGVKQTGNGHRESGLATLDVYSEWKTVYVNFSGRLQRAQIDN